MPFKLPDRPQGLDSVRVISAVGFSHVSRRKKLIGKNAKKDVHGSEAVDKVLRIFTNEGLDGVGFGNVSANEAAGLIGLSLAELWDMIGTARSPVGRADHALFDLTGKALGRPAWSLMGGAGSEWVPVYDTTLYFSDLLPEFEHLGVGRLLDEVDEGLREGHRAFKVKVGRGSRWMEAEDGLRRDIEIVRRLSDHVGPEIQLMADANDQYGVETAKRFLGEVGDRLVFAEEMFPESIDEGIEMRAWIRSQGLKTLLADGESEHDPNVHEQLARAGALDIVQPDIRALGLALQLSLSDALSDVRHVSVAAHNWGSYFGTYKMLQLGRGIPNFRIAELDRTYTDLVDDSEWQLKDGRVRVPETPGCGIRIRERVFRERYLPEAWIVGDTDVPAKWTSNGAA